MAEISVLLCVYNGEKYLREACDSIISQTFADFEFIIVDDGSTDHSADILRSYKDERMKIIQQPNKGLSAALNVGLKASSGKYIARMDADDISLPNRLEYQARFLNEHPECVVVGSNAVVMDEQGNDLYVSDQPTEWEIIRRNLPRTAFFHSAAMFRRNAALSCGGYRVDIKHYYEDLLFFNHLARLGELRNLSIPLLKVRLLPTSITNFDQKSYPLIMAIVERILKTDVFSEYDRMLTEQIYCKNNRRWKESNYYLRLGKIYLEDRMDRRKAIGHFLHSIVKRPVNGISWFNLFLSFLPETGIKKWKEWRRRRYAERWQLACGNPSYDP